MKILVARTDRLGDLALALPVFTFLARVRPQWEIHAMVAPGAEPLLAAQPGVARIWTWSDRWPAPKQAALRADLAAQGFAAALLLQYRRELAWLLLRAGIRRRLGPWSRPSSWFLLNEGLRQRRSRRGLHEAVYNLELAGKLAGLGRDAAREQSGPDLPPRLDLEPALLALGREFRAQEAPGCRTLAFVHPGSGGSALDWGPERFAAVANALGKRPGWRVFVTGAGPDKDLVEAVARGLDPQVGVLLDRFTLQDFLGVLSGGDLLIGPSTGPLHLAAGLGLATVGLFPPVAGMAPRRWGQLGPRAIQLVPEVRCPQRLRCARQACTLYNCLEGIDPQTVATRALALMGEPSEGVGHD